MATTTTTSSSSSSWRKRSSPGAFLSSNNNGGGGRSMSTSSINNNASFRGDVSETQDMTEATSFRNLHNNPQQTTGSSAEADAQELMKDNLDIMREIVMRIRDDEEFAASIYADCPRLQHHLELRPDLRPIFEDPNLVRINFEQVYREAGGKLPEDDVEDKKKVGFKVILAKIVNSPFFKVLRVILLIKKIVSCATGGGVSMVRGVFQSMCCHSAAGAGGGLDAPDHLDADGTPDAPTNVGNEETKAALNRVAEHMEDPEVHQHMTELLENDPDGLDEAIQNDPELSALRDSNPLCAELMKDPDTMRILVDPDNLRALGECPDLIEQDFANPDWTPPDVETGGTGGMDALGNVDVDGVDDVEVDVDGDGIDLNGDGIPDQDIDGDGDIDADDLDGGHADGDGGVDADGDEDDDGNPLGDYEMGDADDNNNNPEMAKGHGGGGQRSRNQTRSGQSRAGGFISQIGAGLTDMAASQIVGFSMGDIMGGGGGIPGLDQLDGLDGAADVDAPDDIDTSGVEDAADQAGIDGDTQANAAASAIDNANSLLNDSYGDQLDSLEKGMDDLQERTEGFDGGDQAAQATQGSSQARAAAAVGGGAAPGIAAAEGAVLATGMIGGNENSQNRDVQEEEEQESKSRFGWIGNLGSAIATAAKETVASAVLGDDLGEMLVEKQEERSEREGEDQVHNGKKKP